MQEAARLRNKTVREGLKLFDNEFERNCSFVRKRWMAN